jgi:hypothetical protein
MADLSGGASGMLVRDCKGREADRLVTGMDLGVVSLVAELRGHERQAAKKLGNGKRTSPAAITLALISGRTAKR